MLRRVTTTLRTRQAGGVLPASFGWTAKPAHTARFASSSRVALSPKRPAGAGEKFNKEPFPIVYVWFAASSAITLYFAYRFLFGVTGDKESVKRSFRRGIALRKAGTELAEDAAEKLPAHLPRVYMDIDVDGNPTGRLVFALRTDVAPKTAENFR